MKNELLTVPEAAEYIGMKKSYLQKLMMYKVIPYYKPNGKLCFFDKSDLDAWMRHNRIAALTEVDTQKVIASIARNNNAE